MNCRKPISNYDHRTGKTTEYRCGRCITCRVTIAGEWSFRLLLEAETQPPEGKVAFVTLTYTERNVPRSPDGYETVRMQDLREFVRLLRKYTKWKFKYFGVTEYGRYGNRPHCHLMLFIDELKPQPYWKPIPRHEEHLRENKINYRKYSMLEQQILRAWACKGLVTATEANPARMVYITKDIVKQTMSDVTLHDSQEPTSRTMSPGIGYRAVPILAEGLRKSGNILLEQEGPGHKVDLSTVQYSYRKLEMRPDGFIESVIKTKTFPVSVKLRQMIVREMGGTPIDGEQMAQLTLDKIAKRIDERGLTHVMNTEDKQLRIIKRVFRDKGLI